jgi:hypothetical protein
VCEFRELVFNIVITLEELRRDLGLAFEIDKWRYVSLLPYCLLELLQSLKLLFMVLPLVYGLPTKIKMFSSRGATRFEFGNGRAGL